MQDFDNLNDLLNYITCQLTRRSKNGTFLLDSMSLLCKEQDRESNEFPCWRRLGAAIGDRSQWQRHYPPDLRHYQALTPPEPEPQENLIYSAQWASRWTKVLGNQNPERRSASGGDGWLAMGRPWIFVWHPWQPYRALKSPSKWPKTTKNGHFRHF